MSPSEAARTRHRRERERAERVASSADSTTDEDAIIARLRLEALGGNVQAAKELREWIKAQRERQQGAESIDTATSYAQLSEAQRLELRARLLDETLREMGAGDLIRTGSAHHVTVVRQSE